MATPTPEPTIPREWRTLAHDLEEGPIPNDAVGAFPMTQFMARALRSLDETPAMLLLRLAKGGNLSDVASLLEMSISQVRTTKRVAHRDLLAVFDEAWPRFEAWLAEPASRRIRVVRFSESPVDLGPLGSLEPEIAIRAFADLGTNRHHALKLVPLEGKRFLLLDARWDNRNEVEGLLRERGTLEPISTVAELSGYDSFILNHATKAFEGVRRTRDGRLYSAHLSKTQIANLLVRELDARGYVRWNSGALLALMRHFAPRRAGGLNRGALERVLDNLGTDIVRPVRGSGEWECILFRPGPSMEKPAHPTTPLRSVMRSEGAIPTATTTVSETSAPEESGNPPASSPAHRIARGPDSNLSDAVRGLLLERATSMAFIEIARELATTLREVRHVFHLTLIPCGAVATEDGRRWRLASWSRGRHREDDMAKAPTMTKQDEDR